VPLDRQSAINHQRAAGLRRSDHIRASTQIGAGHEA
jgi:hypothetical protein